MSTNSIINNQQTMSSIEIAELTGKQHKDVLKAIRNMEAAWEKVCRRNFALTSRTIIQPNGGTRCIPYYELSKTECLYIATKFNDEARAKLVLRWEELENNNRETIANNRCREKGQLMLASKEELVLMANQIIGDEVRAENEDTTNCLTATDVAKLWSMKVTAFNQMLVDMGVQKRRDGRYYINGKFEGLGFTKYRLHRYYAKEGPVKDILYMVWTPQGVEWLSTFVKSNATSQKGSVIVYEVEGVRYEVKIKK